MNFNIPNKEVHRYEHWSKARFGPQYLTLSSSGTLSSTLPNSVKNGTSVPGFRKKIANGESASSSYSRTDINTKQSPLVQCHAVQVHPLTGKTQETKLIDYVVLNSSFNSWLSWSDAELRDQALSKLYRKLHRDRGDYNALVPIGELREFRQLVTSTWSSVAFFTSYLLRLRNRYRRVALDRAIADAWLTWSFGISPTLSDLSDAASSIESFKRRKHKTVFKGTATDVRMVPLSPATLVSSHTGKLKRMDVAVQSLTYRFKAGYDYGIIDSANDYSIVQDLGLQFRNLVPTAWELLPWSWLIDYVTTTGDLINDTFQVPSKPLIYLTEAKINRVQYYPRFYFEPAGADPFSGEDAAYMREANFRPGEYEAYSYVRTNLDLLPRRMLRFKSWAEISQYWFTKSLNLLAIARTRGRG